MRLLIPIFACCLLFTSCSAFKHSDDGTTSEKKGWARFFPFLKKEEVQAPVKETSRAVKKEVTQKTAAVEPLPQATATDQDYALSQQLRSPDLLKELPGGNAERETTSAPAVPQMNSAPVVIKAEEPQIPAMPTSTTPVPPQDTDMKKLPTKQQ